jgi:putative peptide maturation system protein
MTDALVIADAYEWLRSVRELAPPDARERLAALRARHPHVQLRLVWEAREAAHACHYDLLIELADGSVVSLACSPADATPWALGRAQRASSYEVVRVNGRSIDAPTAMGLLDAIWGELRVLHRLVDFALIEEAAEMWGLAASADELQAEVDRFRAERGLTTVEATEAFLRARGLPLAMLERLVESAALERRLRERVAADGHDFSTWLDDRRRRATITWFWGPTHLARNQDGGLVF